MVYEILSEPASDAIRNEAATCGDLSDTTKTTATVEKVRGLSLSHVHGQERERWLKEYLSAVALYGARTREAKILALEAWFNTGNGVIVNTSTGDTTYGRQQTLSKATWSSLDQSETWIRGCVNSLAAEAAVRPTLITVHRLWTAQSESGPNQTEKQLCEVIGAFDFAVPNNVSQDDAAAGGLLRRRRESEEDLYKRAFVSLSSAANLRDMLQQYPKCQYCRLEATKMQETLPPPPPPVSPVVASAGFETVLGTAGFDIKPLQDYREKSAALDFVVAQRQSEPRVTQAKNDKSQAERRALETLEKDLKLPKQMAADYLLP